VAKWLIRIAGAAFLAALLSWLLFEAAPGSTAERAARAAGFVNSEATSSEQVQRDEIVAEVAHKLGVDGSATWRIVRSSLKVLVLDLGQSWRFRRPAAEMLAAALPLTALMMLFALAFAVLVASVLAERAVRKRSSDRIIVGIAGAMTAVPTVWVGLLLLAALGGAGLGSHRVALVAATLTMAVVPTAVLVQHVRTALLAAIAEPWARTVLASGASRAQMLARARRLVAARVLPLLTTLTAYLLGASLVVEKVFGLRGLGMLLVDASAHGDAPVVVAVCTVGAVILASVALAVAEARVRLDPRLEEGR
jgi:peptide/nickel transport system permease protein